MTAQKGLQTMIRELTDEMSPKSQFFDGGDAVLLCLSLKKSQIVSSSN
jgi:hypothetical protein